MLPKQLRLSRSFAVIFQKGAKVTTPFFVLRALPAWDHAPRLAVTVSRKAARKAVDRNRIRRRLIAAAVAAGFPDAPQVVCRMVAIGTPAVLTAGFDELSTSFGQAFARVDCWRFPPSPFPPKKPVNKNGAF